VEETGRNLGMSRSITRRDFVNGTSAAMLGSLIASGERANASRVGFRTVS